MFLFHFLYYVICSLNYVYGFIAPKRNAPISLAYRKFISSASSSGPSRCLDNSTALQKKIRFFYCNSIYHCAVVCNGDEGACMMACDSLSDKDTEFQLRVLLNCPDVVTRGNCGIEGSSGWLSNCTSDLSPGGNFKGTVSEFQFSDP